MIIFWGIFMLAYYVNTRAQLTGEYEVHHEACPWLKQVTQPHRLGIFSSCMSAVKAARALYPPADGCKPCSEACHRC
jgi:hypothetical protein